MRKINILLLKFIGLIFICFLMFYGGMKYSYSVFQNNETARIDNLRRELKKEIYNDLSKNIDIVVAKEIEKKKISHLEVNNNSNKIPDDNIQNEKIAKSTHANIFKKKEEVPEYNLDRYLSDLDLDFYTAGGKSTGAKVSCPQTEDNLNKEDKSAKRNKKSKKKKKEEEAEDHKYVESVERTLVQKGSILLPKGTLHIEPSTTWAHFSSNRINIQGFSILPVLVIGDISTETVKRDVAIQNLAFKYGLFNNFQLDTKIPVRAEYDRITNSSTSETTRKTAGLGDIEFGVSRQIGWEHGFIPDLIAAINVKSDTGKSAYNRTIGLGTGHWAVRGSLIAAKSSDPAVVFGSLTYAYNFPETIENYGEVKPGDSIGYSLGTAIALSYQTSLNFSFDHSVTMKMKRNHQNVSGSFLNVANLKAGLNWSINEKSSVAFSVGMGLTNDSPDVTVEMRFPYVF